VGWKEGKRSDPVWIPNGTKGILRVWMVPLGKV
jgi:hypothetical protein